MKTMRYLLILVIVIAALGISQGPAKAGAFTYNSSINLQNLQNAVAGIDIYFYNQDGTEDPNSPVHDTISELGSKVYFPIPASEGFNGSVVIESTTELGSISNILGDVGRAAAAYVGSANGGSPILLPLLMKGNSGYNTWFNVQNTDRVTDASVSVAYSDGTTASATIKPGASQTFDQAGETHSVKVFSAVVSSAQALAVTVIEENTSVMFAYSGFVSGSTEPVIPLVNSNNSGYITGISILNSGDTDSVVTVNYYPSAFGTACIETQTILAHKSNTFALNAFAGVPLPGMTTNCAGLQRFVGSAKVTANSASQPLTAIVNQLKPGRNGEAYGAFDASSASEKVVLPLIMNANSGYFTSINLMNVGGSSAVVTCTFTPYGTVQLPTLSKTLAASEGVSWIQAAADEFGTTKYIGSATCNAPGGQIVAIVNELGASTTADQLLVYEGITPLLAP